MKPKLLRKPIVAVALLLTLAGCSSGSKAHSATNVQTSATASPSATAPSTPALLTMAQARHTYLRLVTPYNRELSALNRDLKTNDLTLFHQHARRLKALARSFAEGIRSTPWPASVQRTARQLGNALPDDVLYWIGMIDTKSWDDVRQVSNHLHESASRYAELLREQLGLPSISSA